MVDIAKLIKVITGYTKNGEPKVGGYRVTLQKTEVEKTCKIQQDDDLIIEYELNKIIITKK